MLDSLSPSMPGGTRAPVRLLAIGLLGSACLWTLAALAADPLVDAKLPSDSELERRVREKLRMSPMLMRESIRVTVSERKATLSGKATTLRAGWEAVRVAGRIDGLRAVRSELTVSSKATDATIGAYVRTVFRGTLRWETLQVEVQDGLVTLRGEVDDARMRLDARRKAASVRGVLGVVDELETPHQDDETIRSHLEKFFSGRLGPRVDGEIEASVSDGRVTLSGEVPRPSSRMDAEDLTWGVNGVVEVRNELVVVPEIHGEPRVIRP
jgi:osmotically-inducible protein OsmY